MNSGPLIFLGLFATMACSWTGFVLGPQIQLSSLSQTSTVAVGDVLPVTYPLAESGVAHAGAEVYRANGCAACHTQMVRPESGADIPRWGIRRSVGDDYLLEPTVMVGSQRIGPDLSNFGKRVDTNDVTGLYLHLYAPSLVTAGSVMPPYPFLFEIHKIGMFPSTNAISFPDSVAPPPGYEIIPRPAARALAAYLISRRQEGYLYEAPPKLQPKKSPASTNAVPTNAVSTNAAPAVATPVPK